MKSRIRHIIFKCTAATAVWVLSTVAVIAIEIPESVKTVIRDRVDDGRTMSMVVALIDEDGVDYFAYGTTSVEGGVTPDENSIYEIGSITKVFTALLLVDMKNRGDLSLDDPIERYLPDTVDAPTRNGASITLVHLSEQTSALPRMPSNFRPKNFRNPFANYTPDLLYEYLSGLELERDIGERFEYSNTGVGLLGHLLELASGKTYEDLVVERISSVLDMPNTRITFTENMKAHLAYGHSNGKQVSNWDLNVLAGAGAIRSSAKDMVTFIRANIGLEDSPLRYAMTETHVPRVNAGAPDSKIGLGWITRTHAQGPSVTWHNGGTGGYRTFVGFSQETRTGVVVLTNSDGQGDDDIGFHLLNSSLPMTNTIKRIEIGMAPSAFESFVGKYQLTDDVVVRVFIRRGTLMSQLTGQASLQIFPESETKFFLKAVDAQMTFEKDDDGKVTGLVIHQGGQNMKAPRIE